MKKVLIFGFILNLLNSQAFASQDSCLNEFLDYRNPKRVEIFNACANGVVIHQAYSQLVYSIITSAIPKAEAWRVAYQAYKKDLSAKIYCDDIQKNLNYDQYIGQIYNFLPEGNDSIRYNYLIKAATQIANIGYSACYKASSAVGFESKNERSRLIQNQILEILK